MFSTESHSSRTEDWQGRLTELLGRMTAGLPPVETQLALAGQLREIVLAAVAAQAPEKEGPPSLPSTESSRFPSATRTTDSAEAAWRPWRQGSLFNIVGVDGLVSAVIEEPEVKTLRVIPDQGYGWEIEFQDGGIRVSISHDGKVVSSRDFKPGAPEDVAPVDDPSGEPPGSTPASAVPSEGTSPSLPDSDKPRPRRVKGTGIISSRPETRTSWQAVLVLGPEATMAMTLRGRTSLGRSPDNDICPEVPDVSRHHAVIEIEGDRCELMDLGSTHGTTVNGEAVTGPERLFDGDLVGLSTFQFFMRGYPRPSDDDLEAEEQPEGRETDDTSADLLPPGAEERPPETSPLVGDAGPLPFQPPPMPAMPPSFAPPAVTPMGAVPISPSPPSLADAAMPPGPQSPRRSPAEAEPPEQVSPPPEPPVAEEPLLEGPPPAVVEERDRIKEAAPPAWSAPPPEESAPARPASPPAGEPGPSWQAPPPPGAPSGPGPSWQAPPPPGAPPGPGPSWQAPPPPGAPPGPGPSWQAPPPPGASPGPGPSWQAPPPPGAPAAPPPPTNVPVCSVCSKSLPPNAAFCVYCGGPASKPVPAEPVPATCSGCGAAIRPGARFCSGCGRRV